MRKSKTAIGPSRSFSPVVLSGKREGLSRGLNGTTTTTKRVVGNGVKLSWTEVAATRPKTIALAEARTIYLRGFPKKRLYRYARDGTLRAFKLGTAWHVAVEDLDDLVARLRMLR